MKVTVSKWDITGHLKTDEDIQMYLEAVAEISRRVRSPYS